MQRIASVFLGVAIAAPVWAQSPVKRTERRDQAVKLYERFLVVQATLQALDQRLDRSARSQHSRESKIEGFESASQLVKRERARYWDDARQEYKHALTIARDPIGANNDAVAAEKSRINQLKDDKTALPAARAELEAELNELRARIAAAAVYKLEIDIRPEYQSTPGIRPEDASSKEMAIDRAKAATALIHYLRVIDAAMAYFDKAVRVNQADAYQDLIANTENAGKSLNDELRPLTTTTNRVGKLRTLARDLAKTADNLSELNQKVLDASSKGNTRLAATDRNQLQEACVEFASLVLDLDDAIMELCEEWKVRPDRNKPLPDPEIKLAEKKEREKPTAPDEPADEHPQPLTAKAAPVKPPPAPINGKARDLLATAKFPQGGWTRVAGGGFQINNQGTFMMGPAPNGEYVIEMSFTLKAQFTDLNDTLKLALWYNRSRFSWTMGPKPRSEGSCGFERINGDGYFMNNTSSSFDLTAEKRNVIEVRVRKEGLEAYVNGERKCQFHTNYSDLSRWWISEGNELEVKTAIPMVIHSARLTLISGSDSSPKQPAQPPKKGRKHKGGR